MYLSLSSSYSGNACAVRQSIINYTINSNVTQFFDWLVTSMKSVNQILENTPIIFESNYIYPNPSNTILISDCNDLVIPNSLLKDYIIYINLNNYVDDDTVNETNVYYKITKSYKCVFDLVK